MEVFVGEGGVKLGDVVRDRISGFAGVATSRTEYLNGCVRWQVSPQHLHDGKPIEAHFFDEEQLDRVDAPAVVPTPRSAGGDRPNPADRKNPA